jgi:hypothetical protein
MLANFCPTTITTISQLGLIAGFGIEMTPLGYAWRLPIFLITLGKAITIGFVKNLA